MKIKCLAFLGLVLLMSHDVISQNEVNQAVLSNGSKTKVSSKQSEENNSKPVLSNGAVNSTNSNQKQKKVEPKKTPELGNMIKKGDEN